MSNGDENALMMRNEERNKIDKMVENGDGRTGIKISERKMLNGKTSTTKDDGREARMKKYKEERRKQLEQVAARIETGGRENGRLQSQQMTTTPRRYISRPKSTTPVASTLSDSHRVTSGDASSGSEVITVRTTRASRLRAAKVGATDTSTANKRPAVSTANDGKEISPVSIANTDQSCVSSRVLCQEKDKSSKRKSNLNRSLNSEEVSADTNDDSVNSRRRRRRVLNPSDILQSLQDRSVSSGSNNTSTRVTSLPSPSTSATQSTTTSSIKPRSNSTNMSRRSELSVHMDNARRGIGNDSSNKMKSIGDTSIAMKHSTSSPWDDIKCKTKAINLIENPRSRPVPARSFTSKSKIDYENRKSSSENEEYYDNFKKVCRSKSSKAKFIDQPVDYWSDTMDPKDVKITFNTANNVRKVFSDKVNVQCTSKNTDLFRRTDELAAYTRETLNSVEKLTNKNQQSPKRELVDRKKSISKSPEKLLNKNINDQKIKDHHEENDMQEELLKPSSILKKKISQDEPTVSNVVSLPPSSVHTHAPVSILKRKASHDEPGPSNISSLNAPPVTFSPNVVDPIPTRKKPGILKKRCSLDESQVRFRSFSPEVNLVEGSNDCRSILKNQRRSSLEEIIRTHSPDIQPPHGILKRKTSRGEEEYGGRSLGSPEPQSILKRRSGTSSSGSSGNSPHVSIATAVILAAAGGAEMVLEPVKPILKKKSFSDENPFMDSLNTEIPKPILKKKSSTETDDQEDRPKKPILKTSRKSSQDDSYSSKEVIDYNIDSPRYSMFRSKSNYNSGESGSECETVRPILKQSSSREHSPRPKLSFCNDDRDTLNLRSSTPWPADSVGRKTKFVRRSMTVADSDINSILKSRNMEFEQEHNSDESSSSLYKRSLSVFEMVKNFEKCSMSSTGAIPKRSNLKNSRHRHSVLPVMFTDFKKSTQSLEPVQNFQAGSLQTSEKSTSPVEVQESLFSQSYNNKEQNSNGDFSESDLMLISLTNNDSKLTTPSSLPNESGDSGIQSKMSFVTEEEKQQENSNQDDLSPTELCRSNSVSAKANIFKQLEAQMKAVAEEAKTVKLNKAGNRGIQRYKNRNQISSPTAENRFSTQPVTLDELHEAKRQSAEFKEKDVVEKDETNDDEAEPYKLSLAERVKLFDQKVTQDKFPASPGGGSPSRPRHLRFKTQPITSDEVETAKLINPLMASFVKPPDSKSLEGKTMTEVKDKILEHASKMLTTEVRGILKSKSAVSPIPTNTSSCELLENVETVCKNSAPQDTSDDEGVSTEDVSSGSDNLTTTKKVKFNHKDKRTRERCSSNEKENDQNIDTLNMKNLNMTEVQQKLGDCITEITLKKARKHLEEVQHISSSEETPQTSDGESSGGREVQRIINNESSARKRQANPNKYKENHNVVLTKSKSQSALAQKVNLEVVSNNIIQVENTKKVTSADAIPLHVGCICPPSGGINRGGVRRSLTLPLRPASDGGNEMSGGGTIADRVAELQSNGNNEWKKRQTKLNTATDELYQLSNIVQKNIYNDSLATDNGEKNSILAARIVKLETASQQWKKKVEANDALNFSVAGRMQQEALDIPSSRLPILASSDKKKRIPKAMRFRGKEEETQTTSTPVSPDKTHNKNKFIRSISAPGVAEEENDNGKEPEEIIPKVGRRVIVPRADNETFTSFFESVTKSTASANNHIIISEDDLDSVQRNSSDLLAIKKTVKVQRRHAATSRNPIKALAARTDIQQEYTEILHGVADRESRRMNIEKLAKASNMAVEALAGLASKEDFTAVSLKKNSNSTVGSHLPFKDLMLIHVKGRRHVQIRLVEPIVNSINKGDCYILVTPTQVYNYIGAYSNVIEQARGADIALHIQQNKDLGCKCNNVITISEIKGNYSKSHMEKFWRLLGGNLDDKIVDAGHPEEDAIYETAIIETNMIYELDDKELVPVEDYWGSIPKIEMLDSLKTFVFDFGSEMYTWSGKNVPLEQRKEALRLAKELWSSGYNYTDCNISPVHAVDFLGARDKIELDELRKKSEYRPDWSLFCKISEHAESILFRGKFLDWPDYSRIIKVKGDETDKGSDSTVIIRPCDAEEMRGSELPLPDLILEGSHLGRGSDYFDEETNRHFQIKTLGVKVWHIMEYDYQEIPEESIGQFYSGDSYIIRWQYMLTVTGRELSGKPSKHSMLGRDRCAYFCWQGRDAPLHEKGAAALLTVQLDLERGPQIRVVEGSETPAFLSLFKGGMIIYMGRKENENNVKTRLFLCRGDIETEVHLFEVPLDVQQLRSRASFLLTDNTKNQITIWHGVKSSNGNRELALTVAKKLKTEKPIDLQFSELPIKIVEVQEGFEETEFHDYFTKFNSKLYFSLIENSLPFNQTPRLFHFSSASGVFKVTEIQCPYKSDQLTAYPFLQNDLYSVSQPALFLFDNNHELWVWQGWWPETDSDSDSDTEKTLSDQTGSGQHRWQAERRAAMQTAINYWQGSTDEPIPAFLVWAGLEPLQFTNLFPTWTEREDVTELNLKEGRKKGEIMKIEVELSRLTQSTYPLSELLQRPLPDGVDPSHLEDYLSNGDFEYLLGMTRSEFQKLPIWKQTNIKKDKGLF